MEENVFEEKEKITPTKNHLKNGGLMKRTLKELETLDIKLSDVFTFDTVAINLSWEKAIRLINYNAGKKVLRWDHTFEEALEVIKIFLV